jgi:hypothetical protein
MKEIDPWKRNPNGDQPELTNNGRYVNPQVVGFEDENGTIIGMDRDRAIQQGLINERDVPRRSEDITVYSHRVQEEAIKKIRGG